MQYIIINTNIHYVSTLHMFSESRSKKGNCLVVSTEVSWASASPRQPMRSLMLGMADGLTGLMGVTGSPSKGFDGLLPEEARNQKGDDLKQSHVFLVLVVKGFIKPQ